MKKRRVLSLLLALMMLLLGINYGESKEVNAAEIKSGVKVTKVTVTKSRVDVKVKISSDGRMSAMEIITLLKDMKTESGRSLR